MLEFRKHRHFINPNSFEISLQLQFELTKNRDTYQGRSLIAIQIELRSMQRKNPLLGYQPFRIPNWINRDRFQRLFGARRAG